jgi:hypothetical protein
MSRPVLLSQEGESKPAKAKRSDRHRIAPARGVSFFAYFLVDTRK